MKAITQRTKFVFMIVAVVAVGCLATSAVWAISTMHSTPPVRTADQSHSPKPAPSATASPGAATPAIAQTVTCPSPNKQVSSASELTKALSAARPGDVIELAAGIYTGNFVANTVATATDPIWLCGKSDSVLDGKETSSGYVLHLDGTSHWNLVGFSIRNGQKGIVTDRASFNTINNLSVRGTGDEGIHLRAGSTDNTVRGNDVSNTGLLKAKFGEGIYIGTAQKNWCTISNCQPDRSDRNIIMGNHISHTTAENVDIKEGTTGGQLLGNSFDGTGMVDAGATAWVNVKGNKWVVDGNSGTNSIGDGFQSHQILSGWGDDNTFRNNKAAVNGPGFGFHLAPPLNNVVECNNTVTGAAHGPSSITCSGG